MNRGLWNLIALFSCTVAIVSGVMTALAAGIGIQVFIPDIVIGGFTYKVNLIELGWYVAYVYAIAQVVQALTPPGSPGFERAARLGSWLALVMFAGTLAAMFVQLGVDGGNVRQIMETSSPFKLVVLLLGFAIVDVFLLPWLKGKIHGISSTSHAIEPLVVDHHAHVASAPAALQLIGHADKVYYFDCRGKDIEVIPSAIENGDPTVRVFEPHAA